MAAMEIKLVGDLEHQRVPVELVTRYVGYATRTAPAQYYENPRLGLDYESYNVSDACGGYSELQAKLCIPTRDWCEFRLPQTITTEAKDGQEATTYRMLNLDIKMETGTGKTFVYTKTIYELHKQFGLNKFVVIVPTLPIKSGAREFIADPYTQNFFRETCHYDSEIQLCELQAQKNKKGKKYFPAAVRDFVAGSFRNQNKVYVLLVNMQLLTTGKMLSRDDYDVTFEGFYRPFNAIRSTRPIVIIDEPHKFDRNNAAYKAILNEIQPQCILRYGATFPKSMEGKGKKKKEVTDYMNLLYNLTPGMAFQHHLIKGIAKEHLETTDGANEKIKITEIEGKESVRLTHFKEQGRQTFEMKAGDSLSIISPKMAGLSIDGIGKNIVLLSNGLEKRKGEELIVSAYADQYQEQMLRLAIRRHLETEAENFNREVKIKTLALFFIDNIDSYRGEHPWLKEAFERQLQLEIESFMLNNELREDYKSYLQATLNDLQATQAAYFAQDNNDSDELVAKEVDAILHGKKELLSLQDEKGRWNTMRFLFSKWTLKEGWDNPNVFTIAKLRSSGSEISKMQEVGRGLRLPVNVKGDRVTGNFVLNYIVDFTEEDFARKLVTEINMQTTLSLPTMVSEDMLNTIAEKRGVDASSVLDEIYHSGIITNLISRNLDGADSLERLYMAYPELAEQGVYENVQDRNKIRKPNTVRIRSAQFEELRSLWEKLNQKYVLNYKHGVDAFLNQELPKTIISPALFSYQTMTSSRSVVETNKDGATRVDDSGVTFIVEGKTMSYHDFLFKINQATSIPIVSLHQALLKMQKEYPEIKQTFINDATALRIINGFIDWKATHLQQKITYKQTGFGNKETALTKFDGQPKECIALGLIGIHIDQALASDKYLFDTVVYDSSLEREDIMNDVPQEVVVYGKIPRRSIAIPTVASSSYSPDFMYVVKRKSGKKELNVVMEVKDLWEKKELRGTEAVKNNCAEKFFEQMKKDGYAVKFHTQVRSEKLTEIVKNLLKGN